MEQQVLKIITELTLIILLLVVYVIRPLIKRFLGKEPKDFQEFLTNDFRHFEKRVENIEKRVDNIEQEIAEIKEDIGFLKGKINNLRVN